MSAKHKPLLYIETSVFGFCFDKEPRNVIRREAALTLFEQVRLGVLNAVTSSVTFLELDRTAEPLRSELMALLEDIANDWAERSIGAVNLREGYQVLRVKTPEEVLRYED